MRSPRLFVRHPVLVSGCRPAFLLAALTVACAAPAVPPAQSPAAAALRAEAAPGGAVLPTSFEPNAEAMAEATRGLSLLKLPAGMTASVWAAEPLLENAVAFSFDERGRAFVAESFRRPEAVLDNRDHHRWPSEQYRAGLSDQEKAQLSDELLNVELAAGTVADREAMMRKYFVGDLDRFTERSEQIKRVVDKDDSGVADQSTLFSAGFDGLLDGIMSGVLARKGQVWSTNIPSLWHLGDANDDGIADSKRALSTGYGVRWAFFGHDLHGLRMGPDGRIYFSIGDRGATVKTLEGRTLSVPETGAVFRCEPDGRNLEIFHRGLRNPQELAFDELGNWFAGDNNSDGGDKARLVHLVEGADSGWRMGYQLLGEPRVRGPWNSEQLWHPPFRDQAAYIVPPVANLGNGPAGFAYHPGTGAPAHLRKHFFMADFRGQPGGSGIWSFRMLNQGAGFKLDNPQQFAWGTLATDVEFGPDGRMYLLDWVMGWGPTGKGRIHRLDDDKHGADHVDLRPLLSRDLTGADSKELLALLGHADQRVRLEAQFALAAGNRFEPLIQAVGDAGLPLLARVHALWGVGQILRAGAAGTQALVDTLTELVADGNAELRAQAAHMLGDAPGRTTNDKTIAALLAALGDSEGRVAHHAAIALGNMKAAAAVGGLVALIARNADRDPVLRHGGVMGLEGAASAAELTALGAHKSRAVRLAAVVALRRLGDPAVARFLTDADVGVVREAVRAINDARLEPALPALATLWETTIASGRRKLLTDTPVLLRVIEANQRLGDVAGVNRLVSMAADRSLPADVRREAIDAIGDWSAPLPRNRITGAYQKHTEHKRAIEVAQAALAVELPRILDPRNSRKTPLPVLLAATRAAETLRIAAAAPAIAGLIATRNTKAVLRLNALQALANMDTAALDKSLPIAARDPDVDVRLAALKLQVKRTPEATLTLALKSLAATSVKEQQAAIGFLAGLVGAESDAELVKLADRLVANQLPPALHLEVLEAIGARKSEALIARTTTINATKQATDLGPYSESLAGGDAEKGRRLFLFHTQVQCRRCHSTEGHGETVGPSLAGVGRQHDPQYLLEAIVFPSKHFAPGFESVLVTMKSGELHGGTLKTETADTLDVDSIDKGRLLLQKKLVAERERGVSSMPEGFGYILTRRELRDVVAYLTTLK